MIRIFFSWADTVLLGTEGGLREGVGVRVGGEREFKTATDAQQCKHVT